MIEQYDELPKWRYNETVFTEEMIGDAVGFIYLLVGREGEHYIGMKHFYSNTLPPKTKRNADTKRRKVRKMSKWKDYCSSSRHVKNLIEANGKGYFSREILSLHNDLRELHYEETKQLVQRDALYLKDQNGEYVYLNGNIALTHFRPKTKIIHTNPTS